MLALVAWSPKTNHESTRIKTNYLKQRCPGSTGCQPVVRGSLPRTAKRVEKRLRLRAFKHRLPACAPQKMLAPLITFHFSPITRNQGEDAELAGALVSPWA